ncbi:MAG: hypothetical protein PHS41_10195, partial [Victivallaceae bacterium]|nr:hypothetical protein [Victivallaceae bacterium]
MQVESQKLWQKKFSSWLRRPLPGTVTGNCDEATAPALLLRFALSRATACAAIVPSLPDAEKIVRQIHALADLAGESADLLLLPETRRGKLLLVDEEQRRAAALERAADGNFGLIVTSGAGSVAPAVAPGVRRENRLTLRVGDRIAFRALLEFLVKLDYDDEIECVSPGDFARRGGIIDLFSPLCDFPCRVEFWGDRIESLRKFDPATQRSKDDLDSYELVGRALQRSEEAEQCANSDFFAYLPKEAPVVVLWPEIVRETVRRAVEPDRFERFERAMQTLHREERLFLLSGDSLPGLPDGGIAPLFSTVRAEGRESALFRDTLSAQLKAIAARRMQMVFCYSNLETAPEAEALARELSGKGDCATAPGELDSSFLLEEAKLALICDKDCYDPSVA